MVVCVSELFCWKYLLFLCRHCCSLHMLSVWPMDLGRRQRYLGLCKEPKVARGARGQSPTSRHHCFRVTATLDTFTPVLENAARSRHLSLSLEIFVRAPDTFLNGNDASVLLVETVFEGIFDGSRLVRNKCRVLWWYFLEAVLGDVPQTISLCSPSRRRRSRNFRNSSGKCFSCFSSARRFNRTCLSRKIAIKTRILRGGKRSKQMRNTNETGNRRAEEDNKSHQSRTTKRARDHKLRSSCSYEHTHARTHSIKARLITVLLLLLPTYLLITTRLN